MVFLKKKQSQAMVSKPEPTGQRGAKLHTTNKQNTREARGAASKKPPGRIVHRAQTRQKTTRKPPNTKKTVAKASLGKRAAMPLFFCWAFILPSLLVLPLPLLRPPPLPLVLPLLSPLSLQVRSWNIWWDSKRYRLICEHNLLTRLPTPP